MEPLVHNGLQAQDLLDIAAGLPCPEQVRDNDMSDGKLGLVLPDIPGKLLRLPDTFLCQRGVSGAACDLRHIVWSLAMPDHVQFHGNVQPLIAPAMVPRTK